MLFIKCWNELGAFARLNSVTKYLNNPYRVRNAGKLFISFYNAEAVKCVDKIKFRVVTSFT